jgi:hypothetical protein
MEKSAGLKLEQTAGLKGRRMGNLLRDRSVSFAAHAVAYGTVGFVQRFAVLRLVDRAVRVLKFAACASRFLLAGAVVERLIVPRDRSGNRVLHRQTVWCDEVGRESLVSGIADHIGHVLIRALFRTGAASPGHEYDQQQRAPSEKN